MSDRGIEAYRDIYARRASGDAQWQHYGSSCHGGPFVRSLAAYALQHGLSVLDIGTGTGEFPKALRTLHVHARGEDPAVNDGKTTAQLVADGRRYGIVTSWDVLEHVPTVDVPQVLADMATLAPRMLSSICLVPSRNTLDGEQLHATVQPAEWWLARIRESWGEDAEIAHTVSRGDVTLTVAVGMPMPEPQRRITITRMMPPGRASLDEIGDLVVSPVDNVNVVRDWCMRLPAGYELDVCSDGTITEEQLAPLRAAAILGRSDSVTDGDVGDAMIANIETNALRAVDTARAHDWRGQTVVVVGAGPSLTEDVRRELHDLATSGAAVVLATDRAAEMLPFPCPWVTIEPRPVKILDGGRHLGHAVAHVVSHPMRVTNAPAVTWLQEYLCERDDVPGWVAEIPTVRHVTAMAVWYARLCRAKHVVLVGCDYCYGDDGGAYANGAAEDRDGSHFPVACGDGEQRMTRGDWRVNLAEMERIATKLQPLGVSLYQASGMRAARIAGWEHCASLNDALQAIAEDAAGSDEEGDPAAATSSASVAAVAVQPVEASA